MPSIPGRRAAGSSGCEAPRPGPAEDVQHLVTVGALPVEADDIEFATGVELLQVRVQRLIDGIRGGVRLEQFGFQVAEERALVVAQLRLNPVLREEENLAGGFPDPVGAAPVPLRRLDRVRVTRALSRLSRQRWTNNCTEQVACLIREVSIRELIWTSIKKCSNSWSGVRKPAARMGGIVST